MLNINGKLISYARAIEAELIKVRWMREIGSGEEIARLTIKVKIKQVCQAPSGRYVTGRGESPGKRQIRG